VNLKVKLVLTAMKQQLYIKKVVKDVLIVDTLSVKLAGVLCDGFDLYAPRAEYFLEWDTLNVCIVIGHCNL
jgi:hypothetical protein